MASVGTAVGSSFVFASPTSHGVATGSAQVTGVPAHPIAVGTAVGTAEVKSLIFSIGAGTSAGAASVAGVGRELGIGTGTSVGAATVSGTSRAAIIATGTAKGYASVFSGVFAPQRYPGIRKTYSSVTIYPFNPPQNGTFQFQPTLDGQQYTADIRWGLFGERWYLNLSSLQGRRILTLPVIGSPLTDDINIVGGYFTSVLVYRTQSNQFEVLSNPL